MSQKFWSAENSGLEDQNFWNIGPPQTKILVQLWKNGLPTFSLKVHSS